MDVGYIFPFHICSEVTNVLGWGVASARSCPSCAPVPSLSFLFLSIQDVAREAASMNVKKSDLMNVITNLNRLLQFTNMKELNVLSGVTQAVISWMEAKTEALERNGYENESKVPLMNMRVTKTSENIFVFVRGMEYCRGTSSRTPPL